LTDEREIIAQVDIVEAFGRIQILEFGTVQIPDHHTSVFVIADDGT